MIEQYTPLKHLPIDFQTNWQAHLTQPDFSDKGAFWLVNIRRTEPKTFEELRLIVLVIDENGNTIPNVRVAFSYSTAKHYTITNDYEWSPPSPRNADIFYTEGSGQIEHIQGSTVKQGQPGGVTVYILEPSYPSAIVSGCGALSDHTGMHLTFQLRRAGYKTYEERLQALEHQVRLLSGGIDV